MTDQPQPTARSAALVAVEWVVGGLLAWRLIGWLADPDHRPVSGDFGDVFYIAGQRLIHGLSPYRFVSDIGDPYYNPPWFALLVSPLTFLSKVAAVHVWLAINLTLLVATVLLAAKLCGIVLGMRRTILLCLAAAVWQPALAHFELGQCSLLTAASAFAALWAVQNRRPWIAGLLLVIAASKPQLIYLLGPGMTWWCWRRQRSLGVPVGFVIGVLVASGICLLFTTDWAVDLFTKPRPIPTGGAQLSVPFLLETLAGPHAALRVGFWIVSIVGAIAVLARWVWRPDLSLVEQAAFTLAATLVLSPYNHLHDYVLLLLPLIWLAGRSASWWRVAVTAIPVFVLVVIDRWIHSLLEFDWTWHTFSNWFGEDAVAYIYDHSKWDWRFIAMLVPLGLLMLLIRCQKRPAFSAEPNLERQTVVSPT